MEAVSLRIPSRQSLLLPPGSLAFLPTSLHQPLPGEPHQCPNSTERRNLGNQHVVGGAKMLTLSFPLLQRRDGGGQGESNAGDRKQGPGARKHGVQAACRSLNGRLGVPLSGTPAPCTLRSGRCAKSSSRQPIRGFFRFSAHERSPGAGHSSSQARCLDETADTNSILEAVIKAEHLSAGDCTSHLLNWSS